MDFEKHIRGLHDENKFLKEEIREIKRDSEFLQKQADEAYDKISNLNATIKEAKSFIKFLFIYGVGWFMWQIIKNIFYS